MKTALSWGWIAGRDAAQSCETGSNGCDLPTPAQSCLLNNLSCFQSLSRSTNISLSLVISFSAVAHFHPNDEGRAVPPPPGPTMLPRMLFHYLYLLRLET
jgi:hypothetical protein